MHLKSSKFCLLLSLWLFCIHCSKEKAFKPESLPPALFVFGQIDLNAGIDVLVTRAVSTADTVYIRDLLIKDAQVSVVNSYGTRYNVPHLTDGKYVRDTTGLGLLSGEKYRIEVVAPNLPTVQSDWVVIPATVLPDTIGFALDGGFNGNSPTGKGYLRFQPQGGNNNCYLLRMMGVADGFSPIRIGFGLEISQLCELYIRNGDACFDNTCFSANAPAQCLLNADAAYYFPATNELKKYQKILFRFGAVGTEYREYLFSLEQPEEWENGLVEPKPSYSNITGGWGVFFASNTIQHLVYL